VEFICGLCARTSAASGSIAFSELEGREHKMDWYLMVWRRYAEFDGRSRRKEYWMFALFNFLAAILLCAAGGAGIAMSRNYGAVLLIPTGLYILATVIPSVAVTVRRFHDTGKSGWMLLLFMVLGIIPLVGLVTSVIQLVFLCRDSDPGVNQYGPNPKFPGQAAAMFAGNPYLIPTECPAQPQPPAGQNVYRLCSRCGATVNPGSSFCSHCGAQL
jgi:uncharacterized membrane protein YhaH (DUF805 family)